MLVAASAGAIAVFVFAVVRRLPYPHELEWMEGALADQAFRFAGGLPVYTSPTPEHIPFVYSPMMVWLGGLGVCIGFDGVFALRLVAVASTAASALLIYRWVHRETARRVIGLVAIGIFFAGYGWLAWWYDMARNDTLFVSWCLATAYQLLHGGERRWLWAALLATAALLTKQTALMWLPLIGCGALCHDWRNAMRFAMAAVTAMALAVGAMHVASDGWSTFYMFEVPGHHGWVHHYLAAFWTEDMVTICPLLVLVGFGVRKQWRAGARRALFHLFLLGGGFVASWLSRLHVGGFDNVLMYGFAGACVTGPMAARSLRWIGPILLLAQFGWFAHASIERGPATTLLPSAGHRRVHEELAAFVAAQERPVWVVAHGAITMRAGKGSGPHGQAILDLLSLLPKLPDGLLDLSGLRDRSKLSHLSPRALAAFTDLLDGTAQALRERRFGAIVVDEIASGIFLTLFAPGLAGEDGQLGTADDTYVRLPGTLLTEPAALRPLVGCDTHSPYALVPRR